ncbi:MAG TPA: DUF892 family protein [Phycisphaerales bacterium]|nr:DUF892 family protein [Phycisphaerales bacterium]
MIPPPRTPDAQISAQVLDVLRRDAIVDEREVGVSVVDGVVGLSGTIGSQRKRLAAIRAARGVRGVVRVVDRMTVAVPSLEDARVLLITQLDMLHAAEEHDGRLVRELAETASNPKLAVALGALAEKCRARVRRLEVVFDDVAHAGPAPPGRHGPHPAGSGGPPEPSPRVEDGFCRDALRLSRASESEAHVRDAALIAVAEHLAHHRIAGYAAAKTLAGILGFDDAADRLQESLSEERSSDAELARMADDLLERAGAGHETA